MRTTALLALEDGTVFHGESIGAVGQSVGEVVFNTAMTGYQEIITDPSYCRQIVTLTYPHIGNVGVNKDDEESDQVYASGLIIRELSPVMSSWRGEEALDKYLERQNVVGLAGIDTRRLTRLLREKGAQKGCIVAGDNIDVDAAIAAAKAFAGLKGMDLAKDVTCRQSYGWDETRWMLGFGFGKLENPKYNVVAIDYGIKLNILRCLASAGCNVTVVPASASAEEIMSHNPDGVFLSNGPGDPAATGVYAVPVLQDLLKTGKPIFGICLGHQLLARALGCTTSKMHQGHRGANQPVQDLETRRVEITSQNHGFAVDGKNLPKGVSETHVSLFDGSNEGIKWDGHPVFSVQYHPEASPGPTDSHYLFERFTKLMDEA